jgi:hypothetical protein
MPCGDSSVFPSGAIATIGQAFIAKQFSGALIPAACDVICYANAAIAGNVAPIPFPRPTFGAGIDHPEPAEIERLGHMMVAVADQAEQGDDGAKRAIPFGLLPWGKIISVLFTVIQGVILATGESPIPTPDAK